MREIREWKKKGGKEERVRKGDIRTESRDWERRRKKAISNKKKKKNMICNIFLFFSFLSN